MHPVVLSALTLIAFVLHATPGGGVAGPVNASGSQAGKPAQAAAAARIQPWPENRFYWMYEGRPIVLIGGSDEDNLFNHPELSARNLETLAAVGGNYIRASMSSRDPGNVWPFARTPDGRYDLSRFEPEYWRRLDVQLADAHRRRIIVQIEVWETFDFHLEWWLENPFNPSRNINYAGKPTKLVPTWDRHPAKEVQPFFFTVPGLANDTTVLPYQQAFVRKLLDVSLKYPNVLYCLDNETSAPPQWPLYWATFMQEEAKKRRHAIQLAEMWDPWDLRDERHWHTGDRPELFTYFEASQNNWQEGQVHYDRLMWLRDRLARGPGGPRPINNVKVYHRLSNDRPNDPAVGIDRWWQNIFAGAASTRFHRPPNGLGLSEEAQRQIRAARALLDAFDVTRSAPAPDRLAEREPNEAYALAAGDRFAVYFPAGGSVALRTAGRKEGYRVRWLDLAAGRFGEPAPLAAKEGGLVELKAPSPGLAIALVE